MNLIEHTLEWGKSTQISVETNSQSIVWSLRGLINLSELVVNVELCAIKSEIKADIMET